MDAVAYLRAKKRLCKAHAECGGCPLNVEGLERAVGCVCASLERENVEEMVRRVEEWDKKNPAKTRESRLLEEFPNVVRTKEGTIGICPQYVDTDVRCGKAGCEECKQGYWSEEID